MKKSKSKSMTKKLGKSKNRISKSRISKTRISKSRISKMKLKKKSKTIKRKAGFCCNELNRLLFGSAYDVQSSANESLRAMRGMTKEQVRSLNKRHKETMKSYHEKRDISAKDAWIRYIINKEAHLPRNKRRFMNLLDSYGLEKVVNLYASPKTINRHYKIQDDCAREGLYVPEIHEIVPRFNSSSSDERVLNDAWLRFNKGKHRDSSMNRYAKRIHDAHKIKNRDDVYENER